MTKVTISELQVGSIDSGFSFNVVDNVRGDATDDDGGATGRMQQGSLRRSLERQWMAASGSRTSPSAAARRQSRRPPGRVDHRRRCPRRNLEEGLRPARRSHRARWDGSGGCQRTYLGEHRFDLVRGFVINRFSNGIRISGDNNLVAGNWIGSMRPEASTAATGPTGSSRSRGRGQHDRRDGCERSQRHLGQQRRRHQHRRGERHDCHRQLHRDRLPGYRRGRELR